MQAFHADRISACNVNQSVRTQDTCCDVACKLWMVELSCLIWYERQSVHQKCVIVEAENGTSYNSDCFPMFCIQGTARKSRKHKTTVYDFHLQKAIMNNFYFRSHHSLSEEFVDYCLLSLHASLWLNLCCISRNTVHRSLHECMLPYVDAKFYTYWGCLSD